MKEDNTWIIVIAIILAIFVLGGFGMMGFRGGMMGYGSDRLCASIGGIWCYAPNWNAVLNLIISILIIIILVLVIIWLIKQNNKIEKRKK